MKIFKPLFNFYINSSIHVALAIFAFVKITEIYFGVINNPNLDWFVFFATIVGYNFVKYMGVAKQHYTNYTDNFKAIQVFTSIAFLFLVYFGFQLSLTTVLYFIPLGVLTVLYGIPVLSGFKKNLRNIAHLKIIIIALVWAATTVLLPVLDSDVTFTATVFMYFVQRFLIVLALTLPFDIRDMQFDAISLQTIPQKIGLVRTKRLGLGVMVFALIIEFMFSPLPIAKNAFVVFFFGLLVFIMRSKMSQTKYYSSFWVESLPIFWWLLLLGFLNI